MVLLCSLRKMRKLFLDLQEQFFVAGRQQLTSHGWSMLRSIRADQAEIDCCRKKQQRVRVETASHHPLNSELAMLGRNVRRLSTQVQRTPEEIKAGLAKVERFKKFVQPKGEWEQRVGVVRRALQPWGEGNGGHLVRGLPN